MVGSLQRFNKCAEDNRAERERIGIDGIEYNRRVEDREVIRRLMARFGLDRMVGDKRRAMMKLLTYQGMNELADVMCRWPRPRELGYIAQEMGVTAEYYRSVVPLQGERRRVAGLIGQEGKNFVRVTRDADLMYVWLKRDDRKDSDVVRVHMYASSRSKLTAGKRALLELAEAQGFEPAEGEAVKVSKLKLSPRSKEDWVEDS